MKLVLNGKPYESGRPAATVADLLDDLRLAGNRVAVAVNDEIVPRARHAERRLAEGDRVEVIHAVAGG
jgi:sulfur carrier protein